MALNRNNIGQEVDNEPTLRIETIVDGGVCSTRLVELPLPEEPPLIGSLCPFLTEQDARPYPLRLSSAPAVAFLLPPRLSLRRNPLSLLALARPLH